MAVDDNNSDVNFGTFSALGGIPSITGTVVTPPTPFTKTNVDPPAAQPFTNTNVDPPAQAIPTGGAPGEMNGQGGVVSTPTTFTGGAPGGAPSGGGGGGLPSASSSLLTGGGNGSFAGGALSNPASAAPAGGGGAKVGLDGGGTSTSGFSQFFDDGGAVQDEPDGGDTSGASGMPMSSNIEDRRGPLDDNDQPMSNTNANATTPKYEGAGAQAGLGPGGRLATSGSTGGDWVSSALNMVDQAVQWGRQQYMGQDQGQGGRQNAMPTTDPAQGFANGGAVKAYEDGGPVEDDEQDPGDQGETTTTDEPGAAATAGGNADDDMATGSTGTPGAMHNPDGSPVQVPQVDVMGALKKAGTWAMDSMKADPNDPARKAGDKIKQLLLGMLPDGTFPDAQAAAHAEEQTGQKDPGDASLAAIGQQQDPKSGWAMIQHDRRQHGLYQAFAQAALDQGHLPAAAKAATQMMDNVPDGIHYDFTPGPHGVVASMSKSGGGPVVATKPMSTFQFQAFLKNPQMFDQALDNGGYSLINKAAGAQQQQQQGPRSKSDVDTEIDGIANAKDDSVPNSDADPQYANRRANIATRPIGNNGDHTLPNAHAGEEDMDPRMLQRANSLFPSVGQSAQRSAWIDKMVQQGVTNTQAQSKIDTGVMGKQITAGGKLEGDKIKAEAGTTNATIGADAKRDVQTSKNAGYNQAWATRANATLQAAMAKVNQQGMAEAEKARLSGLKTLLTAAQGGADVADTIKQYEPIMQKLGIQPPQAAPQQQGNVPAPGAGVTAAAQSGQPPVKVQSPADLKQLKSGTRYVTPDGRTGTVP